MSLPPGDKVLWSKSDYVAFLGWRKIKPPRVTETKKRNGSKIIPSRLPGLTKCCPLCLVGQRGLSTNPCIPVPLFLAADSSELTWRSTASSSGVPPTCCSVRSGRPLCLDFPTCALHFKQNPPLVTQWLLQIWLSHPNNIFYHFLRKPSNKVLLCLPKHTWVTSPSQSQPQPRALECYCDCLEGTLQVENETGGSQERLRKNLWMKRCKRHVLGLGV